MARLVGRDDKDKDEKVPYTINWAPALNGSTISTVVWDMGGLTSESEVNTTTLATVRATGGTPGKVYTVTCTVTTSVGSVLQAAIQITVDD